MKKTYCLIALNILFTLFICKAQDSYQPGYVILTNGSRIAGLIELNNNEPWYDQRRIWLKDSASVANNPKTKAKKYKVEDLKFFQVGNRMFDKVHYADMGKLQLKSLGLNDHMMERLAQGKINAHRYYSYPDDFGVTYGKNEDEIAEKEEKKRNDLVRGYKILVQKNNESKLQNAFDYDMQKYFEDTPDVLKNYQSGAYGNEPIVVKKGLAARMVAMAKKVAFKQEEADGIIAAINDYNLKNAGK